MQLGCLTPLRYEYILTNSSSTVPYPFFGEMDLQARLIFYACAMVVNVGLFKLANAIHFGVDRALGRNVSRARRQAKGVTK